MSFYYCWYCRVELHWKLTRQTLHLLLLLLLLLLFFFWLLIMQRYHPSRVLSLVYQPFAVGTLAILTYNEAKINTRRRNLTGYIVFFLSSIVVLVVSVTPDQMTHTHTHTYRPIYIDMSCCTQFHKTIFMR